MKFSGASLAVLLMAVVAAGAAAAKPKRVVSVHLCTDQLLVRLADRSQIAAVTHLATDPEQSYVARRATGLPITNGLAEQVISLKPDLVLAGAFSARATVRILRRFGIPVLDIAEPGDFDDIRRVIRRVAAALGQRRRGEALVAGMDARLAALRADARAVRPLAANYQPNGFTMGPGTIEHAVLVAAGLENVAVRFGMGRVGMVPLERLIAAAPDVIVFNAVEGRAPSLGSRLRRHAALRRALGGVHILTVPPPLWACGSWFTVEAAEWLRRRTRNVPAGMGRR